MSFTYPKKLVRDYIMGEDIVGYQIEDLENDVQFMSQVLIMSRDKKMFYFGSEEVQHNSDFLKCAIQTFPKDITFLNEIVTEGLKFPMDEISRMELVILMSSLKTEDNPEVCYSYGILQHSFYLEKCLILEQWKQKNANDPALLNRMGKGFIWIMEEYHSSFIIIDFFAKRFLDDIFAQEYHFLEKVAHLQLDDVSQLEATGNITFLLNVIRAQDGALADYVSCHTDFLEEWQKEMVRIKKSWYQYEERNEDNRYGILMEQVHYYMEKYSEECSFDEFEITYYIATELGFYEQLKDHVEMDIIFDEDFEKSVMIDKSKMNLLDQKHYRNLKHMIQQIMKQKVVEEFPETYDEDNPPMSSGKIIKMSIKK